MSAHRLAVGLANGGVVAMINAEGARGHQYADKFKYMALDIEAPYAPKRYTEALTAAKALNPAVLIIDSASHMHDGPGGLLEMHDNELDRMAGDDYKKRERMNWTAWIAPKKDENEFIYTMLGMRCPVILCFRAKEKLKIVAGKAPIDLGWQPIASDRIAFETIFTLLLPPHCKGVPDLSLSEMREPFDAMVPSDKPIDEALGRKLAQWASGTTSGAPSGSPSPPFDATEYITAEQMATLETVASEGGVPIQKLRDAAHVTSLDKIQAARFASARAWLDKAVQALAKA